MLFFIAHRSRALEILILDGALFLVFDVVNFPFEALDLRRAGHRADAGPRAGFIHQVDSFIRQVAIGDIAIGQFDGSLDRFVSELRFVMILVFGPQAF